MGNYPWSFSCCPKWSWFFEWVPTRYTGFGNGYTNPNFLISEAWIPWCGWNIWVWWPTRGSLSPTSYGCLGLPQCWPLGILVNGARSLTKPNSFNKIILGGIKAGLPAHALDSLCVCVCIWYEWDVHIHLPWYMGFLHLLICLGENCFAGIEDRMRL